MILRKLSTLLCFLLAGLLFSGTAAGDFSYTIETLGQSPFSDKASLDVSEAVDGVDPITHFKIFGVPEAGLGQVLWQTTAEEVTWDLFNDVFASPHEGFEMVVDAKIPVDAEVSYSVYSLTSEREVVEFNHTRVVAPWSVDTLKIDDLDPGRYVLEAQIRYPDGEDGVWTISKFSQSLRVVAEGIDVPEEEEEYEPAVGDSLEVGDGFRKRLVVPGQIGDSHLPAIAHWNIVPEQTFSGRFEVGVIAHHVDGMDRVEISVDGGPWTVIPNESVNPRTGCVEYWSVLDAQEMKSGEVELRAIAYPKQGKPIEVKPIGHEYSKRDMRLYANVDGSIDFPVIELDAGEHNLSFGKLPERGWLTVRPKPGVKREDVVLVGRNGAGGEGRIKFENLTIRLPGNGGGLMGQYMVKDGKQIGNHIWLDNCRLIGNGPKKQTWWLAHIWETQTYTNCQISDVQNVFHSFRGIQALVRNCEIWNVYEDVFRCPGLFVNVNIRDVDREPMARAQNLRGRQVPHPDIWQARLFHDTIAQDIVAVDNINAQGYFPHNSVNVALVRVNIATQYPYRVIQMMGDTDNVLVESSRFGGNANFRGQMVRNSRLVFRDCAMLDGDLFRPDGSDVPGIIFED